jgi:hypothetical protein
MAIGRTSFFASDPAPTIVRSRYVVVGTQWWHKVGGRLLTYLRRGGSRSSASAKRQLLRVLLAGDAEAREEKEYMANRCYTVINVPKLHTL